MSSFDEQNKPTTTRGISSLDNVGNVGDLAGSLGSGSSSQPFAPSQSSPLAGSNYTSGSPNVNTYGSGIPTGTEFTQSNLPSNFNPSDPGASLNSAGQGSFTSTGTNLSQGSSFGSTTGIPGDSAGSSGLSGGNSSSQFGVSSSSTAGTNVGSSASNTTSSAQQSASNAASSASQSAQNVGSQVSAGLSNTAQQVRDSLPSTEQVKSNIPSTEQIKANIPSAEQIKANLPANRTDVNVGPPMNNTLDIGGAQTSSTGGSTPGGIVKGQDHVESLVAGIGGILLTAPLAAGEFIAGKVHHHTDRAREVANQQGLGNVAEATSGLMSNVAGAAQQKVNQLNASRGPDAAPITQTLSEYASNAAHQAQALANQAIHAAQDLAGRAHDNAPSTGQIKESANNAAAQTSDAASRAANSSSQATGGIGATINSYLHSAQVQAQHLGERVGLTSPHTATSTDASSTGTSASSTGTSAFSGSGSSGLSGVSQSTTPSSGSLSSANTVSGRYDLAQGEIPSETVTKTSTAGIVPPTSGSSNPFNTELESSSTSNNPFTGHASSGATLPSQTQSSNSGATGAVDSSLQYPDSIAQPGSASYGQGRVGSGL